MDRAAGSLGMGDTAPSSAADEAPTDEVPDTSGSHADVPGAEAMKAPEDPREIPSGEEEVELTQDVYATAFCLANNATPGMYSFWPWENRDMLLVWFYLFFIAFTQIFVLVSLLVLHPPTVDSTTHYVNCHNPSSRVVQLLDQTALWDGWPGDTQTAEAGSCRAEGSCYARLSGTGLARCLALERAFSADVNGSLVHFRILEEETYFYQNIFGSDSYLIMLLQVVCCVWVTVQVYFVDFTEVVHLLKFRDFNRWMLPHKGEVLRDNGWVLAIPLLRYVLATGVVAVSCCVTCGYDDAFDIVLNSLAFTFISEVPEMFNQPLIKYYSSKAIEGLDPEEYGTDPIFYLVGEYDEANADPDGNWYDSSWYVTRDGDQPGLLTDFHFRDNGGEYAKPNDPLIQRLKMTFWWVPVAAPLLCWGLFS